MYKRSCEEYFQSGTTSSGVQRIDVDGSGPLAPVYVYCDMNEVKDGHKVGVTKVEHNLKPQTKVRGKNLLDHKRVMKYR